MKRFCKTKIAFNRPLSLNVLLLTTKIWPDMGKEAGEKNERRGKKKASLFSFIFKKIIKKN